MEPTTGALWLRFRRAGIEIIGAKIMVRRAVFQHVVDRGKDGGRDGKMAFCGPQRLFSR